MKHHNLILTLCLVTALNTMTAVLRLNAATISQQAYLKASNTEGGEEWPGTTGDWFGAFVAISGDTVVVSTRYEDSSATGVNGNQSDNNATDSGASYVFVRTGTTWTQQAYLKASNAEAGDYFGIALSVSGDTAVVGAGNEASAVRGVNGNQNDNSAPYAGAVYVFVRNGQSWMQQAYLKASNSEYNDQFGGSVTLSGDTLLVGATGESSNATGVNGNQSNNNAPISGAAYVFVRDGAVWRQQAYLKASNTAGGSPFGDLFGARVSVSGDTAVIGGYFEDSNATGVNGNQANNSAINSGAAYVFTGLGHGPSLTLVSDGAVGFILSYKGVPDVTYRLQRAPALSGPGSQSRRTPPPPPAMSNITKQLRL